EPAPPAVTPAVPQPVAPGSEPWRAAVAADLLALLRGVAGLRGDELTEGDQLSRLGFDSIMYTKLSHQVNVRWDLDATPAAFFGVATAGELVAKIIEEYGEELARHYLPAAPTTPVAAPASASGLLPSSAPVPPSGLLPASGPVPSSGPVAGTGAAGVAEPARVDGVAIVGMAGLLPGSDDLDEFWAHLAAGDDLVTEIPADRWDWRR